MDATEKGYVDRLRELTNELDQHHRAACDAADTGDDKALSQAHVRVGRCVRSMHVVFANLGKAGMDADQAATSKAQTSASVTEGTSAPERNTPGLLHGDAETWLKRARIGGRRS